MNTQNGKQTGLKDKGGQVQPVGNMPVPKG